MTVLWLLDYDRQHLVPGKFKDEIPDVAILEFVGLRHCMDG